MTGNRPTVWLSSCAALLALSLAGCSNGDGATRNAGQQAAATTTASPGAGADLPEITSIGQAGGEAFHAPPNADWVLVAFGRAWVSGWPNGIGVYDASTGHREESVVVPQSPCNAMDAGFGAVWTATCGRKGLARIDPESGAISGWVAAQVTTLDDPTQGATSIAVGEGAVWLLTDDGSCSGCKLVRIDPRRVEITDTYDVPDGATAVRAGLGGVWISYADTDRVLHVEPETGRVATRVEVGAGPHFLDVGEGGVWVMNKTDGSVSHIDPDSDTVVATIPVDAEPIWGGDLTVGAGFVWLRGASEMVAQIDPATDRVVARIGAPQASGSAHADDGQLWVSSHVEKPGGWKVLIYRIPLMP